MLEICRKDLLARNLNRILKLFPKDYNFFPKTFYLPAEYVLVKSVTVRRLISGNKCYSYFVFLCTD